MTRLYQERKVEFDSETQAMDVDGDDEQQHDREQRLPDRDRGALDERDDLVRRLADVALADLPEAPAIA